VGMTPVYARACVLALLGGPHRKPAYTVTRKEHAFGWYWRETLPQALMIGALVLAAVFGLATRSVWGEFDLGSLYWAALFCLFLGGFVRLGWFGVPVRRPRRRAQPPVTVVPPLEREPETREEVAHVERQAS